MNILLTGTQMCLMVYIALGDLVQSSGPIPSLFILINFMLNQLVTKITFWSLHFTPDQQLICTGLVIILQVSSVCLLFGYSVIVFSFFIHILGTRSCNSNTSKTHWFRATNLEMFREFENITKVPQANPIIIVLVLNHTVLNLLVSNQA